MHRLDFHPGVVDELNEAYHWYEAQKMDLGERFFKVLEDAFQLIQTTPEFWPLADLEMRKFVLKKFPYSIVYTINEDHLKNTGSYASTQEARILEGPATVG